MPTLLNVTRIFKKKWIRFWMRYAGLNCSGRVATRLVDMIAPPYKAKDCIHIHLLNEKGYISSKARIFHEDLHLDNNVFIDDRVIIYQGENGGPVRIGKRTHIYRDTIIESGLGGSLTIGAGTYIQPRCQFSAYLGNIEIGSNVQIAPNCAFYPYDHGIDPGELIIKQPLKHEGGIVVDEDALIGVGVIVLDGVRIGKGAVIGAGSVVTKDIPDGAIASGVPCSVMSMRSDLPPRKGTWLC